MKKLIIILSVVLVGVFSACENEDWDFPDHEYTAVYFAYQSPVRTIVLGDDKVFDNSLDNQQKCFIMATLGGVYENETNVMIDVRLDTNLISNLKFGSEDGNDVIAMPQEYYNLPGDMQIVIAPGDMMGGLEVELTDAFFEDERSITNNFVIPLIMESVSNADSILLGSPEVGVNRDTADRRNGDHWGVLPKDYILYAIKYKNPWDATYLRRGVEEAERANGTDTYVYSESNVEYDQVCEVATKSRYEATIDLNATGDGGINIPYELVLEFDGNDISISNIDTITAYTVNGSGEFVKDGDFWGNKQRNVMYLDYEVDFGSSTHSFKDTMVVRDRGQQIETFTPVVVNN